jgi:hypothetical protein
MRSAEQFLPDSSPQEFTDSANLLPLLHGLKLGLQQAQSALLRSNLEEMYANTARLKAILRELLLAAKNSPTDICSPAGSGQSGTRPGIAELKSEIRREGLLYESLIRRKQRTTVLLSRMLSNSAVTYTPQQLGH